MPSTEALPRRTGWVRLVGALVVGVVSAAIAFKLRTVLVPTDPWHYVEAGLTFPAESWNATGLTRYGMVLPMIVVTHFFHESELSFYLTPVLATGLLAGSVFWLAARFYGLLAGLAATTLLLANSVVLVNASRMYPDIYATALATLAIATATAARDRWQRHPRVGGGLVALLVLTGVVVGLSWWMRETVIFAWPVVAAVLLWRRSPPWRVSVPAVVVPAVVLLGVEMLISKLAFGDAFLRFSALTGGNLSDTTNTADLPYLGQSRLSYLMTVPRGALQFADGRWMVAIAVVAVVSGLVFPRKVGLFAAWFVLVLALFTLAGGALRPAAPNIRLDVVRYWVGFIPPMVIAAVGGVATLLRLLAGRWRSRSPALTTSLLGVLVALGLVAGPVTASAYEVHSNPAFIVTDDNAPSQFRTWLQAHDKQVGRIVTDWESKRILPAYTRTFSGRLVARVRWRSLTGGPVRPGDHVVLFSATNYACVFCNDIVNSWLSQHRSEVASWRRVWRSRDGTVVVYRVPRATD